MEIAVGFSRLAMLERGYRDKSGASKPLTGPLAEPTGCLARTPALDSADLHLDSSITTWNAHQIVRSGTDREHRVEDGSLQFVDKQEHYPDGCLLSNLLLIQNFRNHLAPLEKVGEPRPSDLSSFLAALRLGSWGDPIDPNGPLPGSCLSPRRIDGQPVKDGEPEDADQVFTPVSFVQARHLDHTEGDDLLIIARSRFVGQWIPLSPQGSDVPRSLRLTTNRSSSRPSASSWRTVSVSASRSATVSE